MDPQEELKQFLYHTSHDLQAPIRHIREFFKLYVREMESTESEKALRFKSYVLQALDVVDDKQRRLLELSRLNTTELQKNELDILEVIREALCDVEAEMGMKIPVEYHCSSVEVVADYQRCLMAFTQILKNAVQYQDPDRALELKVIVIEKHGHCLIEIIDNGMGISRDRLADAFKPFVRLVPGEVKGSVGMGLTIAQKALQTMGGDIELILQPCGVIARIQLLNASTTVVQEPSSTSSSLRAN